jgi:hypothetical protein
MYVILLKNCWTISSLITVLPTGIYPALSIKCATKFSSYEDAEKYIAKYALTKYNWEIFSLEDAIIRDIIE